ncbi:MAG: hypothetical protein ACKPKO_17000 [Candidatus Fonsibacter sp.]
MKDFVLIVPLDDDDNYDSDSDDEEAPPEPVETEEFRLTTEERVPEAAIGQIFVNTFGKRGRGGGNNKMSREDKIEEKRNELNLVLLQLENYKTNQIVATTLSSISLFTGGMSPTIIKDAMDSVLSLAQLRTLRTGLTTHAEDTRIKMIAKHIFMRDVNTSSDTKKAMELNIKAI